MPEKPTKPKAHFQIGPGGAAFFFVTAMVLTTAIYTQANLLFWSFGLMVGGFFVSMIASALMMRAIVVERVMPMHGVAGEPLVMRYQITNRSSWLPVFGVVIGETWDEKNPQHDPGNRRRIGGTPTGWVLHVGPKQSVLTDAIVWPLERGRVYFESVTYWTSFPCGVIRRIVRYEQRASLLIYPRLLRVRRDMLFRLARGDHSGRHRLDVAGGIAEFYGMREYRPGDSLKMIDWKRTARTGELVTREMNQSSPPKVIVLLDLTKLSEGKPAVEPTGEELYRAADAAYAATVAASAKQSWWQSLFGRGVSETPAEPNKVSEDVLLQAERSICLAASVICEAYLKGYRVGLSVKGVPAQAYPPHHSVLHRADMLQTLAMLELSKRSATAGRVYEAPSVVIRIGRGELRMTDRAFAVLVLGSHQLEEYTTTADDGSASLLVTRTQPTPQLRQPRAVGVGV